MVRLVLKSPMHMARHLDQHPLPNRHTAHSPSTIRRIFMLRSLARRYREQQAYQVLNHREATQDIMDRLETPDTLVNRPSMVALLFSHQEAIHISKIFSGNGY